MDVNILLLAALTDATGNAVTARRIAAHLALDAEGKRAHEVTLLDSVGATSASVKAVAEATKADLAVGVHALLAGPFLRQLGLPYVLIFGGTDLYEPMHELQQKQMARAVAGAARLIAFSPENRARAEWMWPNIAGRVELLPQAVDVEERESDFSLRASLGLSEDDLLYVLPTGIRRVKDPLHVVEAFSAWHLVDPRMHLAIVGAVLEPDYAEGALGVLGTRPGIHYVPALPRPKMLAAMVEADAVLNTSLSEGMCGVLLEAMCLGTPVLARRNAGNESLVVHGHTGLLYDSPAELVCWAQALALSPELAGRLAQTAQVRAVSSHAPAREREAYVRITEEMGSRDRPSALPPPVAPADELAETLRSAERLGLSSDVRSALATLVGDVRASAELSRATRELSGLLGTAPPAVAIAEIARRDLSRSLGRDRARTYHLLLALVQVPAARSRNAARGVDGSVVDATLADLVEWAHHTHAVAGSPGITLEILAWSQRYLRGELFRLGPIQFDLRPFAGPMRVYRHRETRALRAISLDGRTLDLARGVITNEIAAPLMSSEWSIALEPGSPLLEMWLPGALSMVTLHDVAQAMRDAYALFARLSPETVPVGVGGESWRLDPQVLALFPDEPGIHDLQRACSLYPGSLTEEATIRRIFGPDVDRGGLVMLPAERLSSVQRTMRDHLASSSAKLRARGGFVLREEIEKMAQWQ